MTNGPIDEKPISGIASTSEERDVTPPSPASAEEKVDPLGFSQSNPMLIQRMAKNAEGGLDYTFSLTANQTYVLLNFAVMFLITQGLAVFVQQTEQEESQGEAIILGDQLH